VVHATEWDKMDWAGIKYGKFLAATIKFIFIAIVMFGLVKAMNRITKKEAAKPAPIPDDVKLLTEIRDLLKK
jgi:large conductance mechanosensitive channel